jgi:hypothetical protein
LFTISFYMPVDLKALKFGTYSMLFAHMLVPERVIGTQFGSEFGICMLMLLCPSAVPFALAGPGCFTACTLSGGYHAIVRASRDGGPL